ncbi:hypothetical protein [Maricaulis sp.]|uniref:hypothetical protein n=1 Tax=Maricaulis sp. TaxID=1486257 RepID=UPI003A8EF7A6
MSVLRAAALVVAILVLSITAPVEAMAPASPSARPDPNQLYQAFNAAMDADDFATAAEAGDQLAALQIFAQQSDGLKYSVLSRLGYAHRRLDDTETALALWDQAEPLTDHPGWLNYMRVYAYRSLEDWDQAFARLIMLQTQDEELFDAIQLPVMFEVVNELESAGNIEHQQELLELMVSAYDPESPMTTLDYARLRLARIHARAGDMDTALLQVRQIKRGPALDSIRTERLFEPLWSLEGFSQMTDPSAALRTELEEARTVAAAQADLLEPLNTQVRVLLALGRSAEAEATARSADARLHAGEAFLDADEQVSWLLNEWAYALYALGRIEEGNETMRRAANFTESGAANVSQTINLAEMLVYQQRPADALEVIELMNDRSASPYGDMWAWEVQATARRQLGELEASEAILAIMAEHWSDNPSAYQKALISAGRIDEAAALLVRRLEDPEHAPGALAALQQYQPVFTTPAMGLALEWAEQFHALAQRPEVAAALQPVGRIEQSGLVNAYWGKF